MYTPVPFLLPIVNKTVKMLFVIQHLPRWRQRLLCYLPCRSQLSMAAAPSFLAPPFSPPPPQSPLSPTRTCLHWLRVWKVKVIPWVKALMVSDSRAFPPKLTSFQTSADEVSCHQGARLRVQDWDLTGERTVGQLRSLRRSVVSPFNFPTPAAGRPCPRPLSYQADCGVPVGQ